VRIVITGGAGFLGRQLARRLLDAGELTAGDGARRAISAITLFDSVAVPPVEGGDPRLRTKVGDIADRAALADALGPGADSVFHLAAVVSGAAEADFDLGMRVNLEGTRALLEACRALKSPPRLVFASSVAVFGGALPKTILDNTPLTPQSSYGIQKAIGELLVGDYSRKGFIDGRSVRLPTVVVRPGKPNLAASTFASSILREPLAGAEANCPVGREARMWILSPRQAVRSLLHAHDLPESAWSGNRAINLPGIDVSIGEMVASLGRIAGQRAVERLRWQPDPAIERLVGGWPHRFDPARALALGFRGDADIDAILRAHIEDELGGRLPA
jgi:nucleoside-diphosphate-sugar epimerase